MRIRVACFLALAALSSATLAEPVIPETSSSAADAWQPNQPFYSSPAQVAASEEDERLQEIKSQSGDPLSTYDMINANLSEADALSEAVEGAYQDRLKITSYPERRLLENSQKAWVSYIDAQCIAEGAAETGGSIQVVLESSCQVRETKVRLLWLSEGQVSEDGYRTGQAAIEERASSK